MINKIKKINIRIIIIAILIVFSMLVFYQYLFQGKLFLPKGILSDIIRVNLPTYYHIYDNILTSGNLWSWSMGIGTSMFVHADALFDPFTYIIFLFGREGIPSMLVWSFIVKILFEGICFSYYISYFKLNKFAVICSSVMYAYCGYSIIMGGNLSLGTIMVYAPLLFLGLEYYIKKNKKILLLISLLCICIYSYYYFYIIGIISIIYLGSKTYKNKRLFFHKMLGLFLLSILVITTSAVALFPQLKLTLNSSRMNSGSDINFGLHLFIPEIKSYATALLRLFGNNILGDAITSPYVGYAYGGNHDYFETNWFVSSLTIPLLLQYLYYEKTKVKKVCFWIFVISLATIFPVFSYTFNAFSTINYRWMFIVSFMICVMLAHAINKIISVGEINLSVLIFSYIFSFIIIVMSIITLGAFGDVSTQNIILNIVNNSQIYILTILVSYILFLVLAIITNLREIRYFTSTLMITIICILLIEIPINYKQWLGSDNSTSNYNAELYSGYQDSSYQIIQEIQASDKDFYRFNKDFDSVVDLNNIPSDNDAMAQNYFGLKSYCSINNENYIKFLQTLGIYVALPLSIESFKEAGIPPEEVNGAHLNYINGVGNNQNLLSYLGVKYYIMENEWPLSDQISMLNQYDGLNIYENKTYFPLAFINYNKMSIDEFLKLDYEERINALLEYTIISDDLNTTEMKGVVNSLDISSKNKQNDFRLISFDNDSFMFTIKANKNAEFISFSIPYDESWHVYIDGKKVKTHKVNISLLGADISEGSHNVTVKYVPKSWQLGKLISSISILLVCSYSIAKKIISIKKEKGISKV